MHMPIVTLEQARRFTRGHSSRLVHLGLVGAWLCRAVRQRRGELIDLGKLVREPRRVEEGPKVKACKSDLLIFHWSELTIVIGTVRLLDHQHHSEFEDIRPYHMHGRGEGRPTLSAGWSFNTSQAAAHILCRLIACVKKKCLTFSAICPSASLEFLD